MPLMSQDKQYAANRRLLEYQVRMEIKEKIVVNKWRFLSMAVRCILFDFTSGIIIPLWQRPWRKHDSADLSEW